MVRLWQYRVFFSQQRLYSSWWGASKDAQLVKCLSVMQLSPHRKYQLSLRIHSLTRRLFPPYKEWTIQYSLSIFLFEWGSVLPDRFIYHGALELVLCHVYIIIGFFKAFTGGNSMPLSIELADPHQAMNLYVVKCLLDGFGSAEMPFVAGKYRSTAILIFAYYTYKKYKACVLKYWPWELISFHDYIKVNTKRIRIISLNGLISIRKGCSSICIYSVFMAKGLNS